MCKANFKPSKNAITMRIWTNRRGSRNTLRLFRLPYVKYSTGTNKTIRAVYRALRKPDSTVARQGVRTTESVTEIRTTERYAFSRASAISRPAPLFCILFSGKTEKSMPAERQLRSRNHNGTSVNTKNVPRPLGAACAIAGAKEASPLSG